MQNISTAKRFRPAIFKGLFLLSLFTQVYSQEQVCDPWQTVTPLPSAQAIHAATMGNGTLVAVGNEVILTSTDQGETFTVHHQKNSVFFCVLWTGERFIAGTNSGQIFSSDDGFTWVLRLQAPSFTRFYSLVTNGDLILATGSGKPAVSTNGLDWTVRQNGISALDVFWNGTFFFSLSSFFEHRWTTNAETWTLQSLGIFDDMNDMTFNGSTYVALGTQFIYRSTSGSGWSAAPYPFNSRFRVALSANGWHFLSGADKLVRSNDGENWELVHQFAGYHTLGEILWTGSKYLAFGAGGVLYESTTGAAWTLKNAQFHATPNELEWDGEQFFILAQDNHWLTSENGITWQTTKLPKAADPDLTWQEAAISPTGIMLSGPMDQVLFSEDGETWTIRNTNTGVRLYALSWVNNAWFASGSDRLLYRSEDGMNWQSHAIHPSNSSYFFRDIGYYNGTYIVTGATGSPNGYTATSQDLQNWDINYIPNVGGLEHLEWVGDRFFVGGREGQILESFDGIQWQARDLGFEDAWIESIRFDGTNIYVVDTAGKIITATDPDGPWETIGPEPVNSAHFFATNGSIQVLANRSSGVWNQACRPCFTQSSLADHLSNWGPQLDISELVIAVNSPCP